jgi:rubrerythrin
MQFRDLNEAQLLAVAITAEEEDARIYRDFAERLRADFPAMTEPFTRMADEESGHRHRLLDLYRSRFGEHVPFIRRQDMKGFQMRKPSWLLAAPTPEQARNEAAPSAASSSSSWAGSSARGEGATFRAA